MPCIGQRNRLRANRQPIAGKDLGTWRAGQMVDVKAKVLGKPAVQKNEVRGRSHSGSDP